MSQLSKKTVALLGVTSWVGAYVGALCGASWAIPVVCTAWGVAIVIPILSMKDPVAEVKDKATKLKDNVVKQVADIQVKAAAASMKDQFMAWLYTPTLKEFAVFSICVAFIAVVMRTMKRWSLQKVTKHEVQKKLESMWTIVDYILAAAVAPVVAKYGLAGVIRMFGYLRHVAFYFRTLFDGASFFKRELWDEAPPAKRPGLGYQAFVKAGDTITLKSDEVESKHDSEPSSVTETSVRSIGAQVADGFVKKLDDPEFQQKVTALAQSPMTNTVMHEEIRRGWDAIEAQTEAAEVQSMAEAAVELNPTASKHRRIYYVIIALILVLIAIAGMTWYIMQDNENKPPEQEKPEAKKKEVVKDAKRKPICPEWSKTGKCSQPDKCAHHHPKNGAWKPLCDNVKCAGSATCGKFHTFRKHKVESKTETVVKGCVHMNDCPLKAASSATQCCNTVCGGHHCIHFVGCKPTQKEHAVHADECTCLDCVIAASKNIEAPKLSVTDRVKSVARKFVALVGPAKKEARGIVRKLGRRFYVQYETNPGMLTEEYPISYRRAKQLVQDDDFALDDYDDDRASDVSYGSDHWGADEGDRAPMGRRAQRNLHRGVAVWTGDHWEGKCESKMAAPRVRVDPESVGCVIVKTPKETRHLNAVCTLGVWVFAAHVFDWLDMSEVEVELKTQTEDLHINKDDLKRVVVNGTPIDLMVIRKVKTQRPLKSLKCAEPKAGEHTVMYTMDEKRHMYFSFGIMGDIIKSTLVTHKVTTDDGDCTGAFVNENGHLTCFHIVGGPVHNTAIPLTQVVKDAILAAIAGNQ